MPGEDVKIIGLITEYNSIEELSRIDEIDNASTTVLNRDFAIVFIPSNRIAENLLCQSSINEAKTNYYDTATV